MRHITRTLLLVSVAASFATSLPAQVVTYGAPSPAGFTGSFHSGGQIPHIGNPTFNVQVTGAANGFGGLLGVSVAPASIPLGAITLLIDPVGFTLIDLPPPQAAFLFPVPSLPALVGSIAFGQVALADPTLPGGIGLTNGLVLTIMPDRTPTRAYFGGQDFSGGPATGQLSVMDLTTVPPSFRATGSLGFAGTISNNYSPKITVPESIGIAYALGNGTTNQFVRILDVSADPAGIVNWPVLGDIPLAQEISPTVGNRDMEVTEDNLLLFVTSGAAGSSAAVVLDVFDVSNVPVSIPTAPVQSLSYPGAGAGPGGLDLSPDGSRLALLLGADNQQTVTLFDVLPGASLPLLQTAVINLASYAGAGVPNDVHFSPDGSLLFVSGGNGFFSVIDVSGPSPAVLIPGNIWSTNGASASARHGSAAAIMDGRQVAVLGEPPTDGSALYHVIELNTMSASFGMPAALPFTTNPGGNISNHRSRARQSIVIAIDGTGATANCQWIDVIDLSQPTPTGFVSWRVQMPSTTSLTPPGLSCIPRDFDIL